MSIYEIENFKKIVKRVRDTLPDDKILILSDSDADGVTSALLFRLLFNRMGCRVKNYFFKPGDNEIKTISIKEIIKRNLDTKLVIFLDMSFENSVDISFDFPNIDFIYIDHHLRKIIEDTKNYTFFDIRALGLNPVISTSSVSWKIVKSIDKELENSAWIAAIGAYGDYMIDKDEELINYMKEKYDELCKPIGLNYSLIMIAFILNFSNRKYPKILMKILEEAYEKGNPYYFLKNKRTREILFEILTDLEDILNKFEEKNYIKKEDIIFFFTRNSVLSGEVIRKDIKMKDEIIISLKPKYKSLIRKIFGIPSEYSISARTKANYIDLGKTLSEVLGELGFEGGGHPKAAGGNVSREKLNEFIEKFYKKVKNLKKEKK